MTSQRKEMHDKRRREAWAERRRICSQAHPLPTDSVGEKGTAAVAPTTMVVSAVAAPAQAVNASPPASSMPTPPDSLQKRLKTVTEAVQSGSRSTSLQDNIPPTTIPPLSMTVPPMLKQPMPFMTAHLLCHPGLYIYLPTHPG